ncbi:hypothetical protein ACJX0J_004613 [Zea mays]
MNLRYVEIFFSIYRDRDIEFIGMLFTFHVLRMYPLEMGFINNFILKKRVGSRIYTAEKRLVMVLYALFYEERDLWGLYCLYISYGYSLDLWMKIQKRKRRALRLKSIAYPLQNRLSLIGRGTSFTIIIYYIKNKYI